jgi:hypothetical protein
MSIIRSSTFSALIHSPSAPESDSGHESEVGARRNSPTCPGAIPWGFVGMIGLIVVIECFVGRNWLDFSDPASLSWRFSAAAVATESPGGELLCLGDSLIKHGLLPGVIENETGRRTVNLSAARAPTLLTYFFLRRALDAGARPRAIIINAKPAVLLAGPEFNARYWQEVITPRECLEFSLVARNSPFILATIVGRLVPSLRSRLEIRSQVMAAIRGDTDPIPEMNRILLRNWTVNGGANIAAVRPVLQYEDESEIEHKLHPGLFFVDPTNAEGMERLLQLAVAHDIPVFWLLTPLSPALQARRDKSGAEAGYENFVRSFLRRYPQTLTVLDGRRGDYPATLFTDLTHLNRQGALVLSHAVAQTIRPLLARPPVGAWVSLVCPSGRPAESGVVVEDLEQSRRMLTEHRAAYFSSR